MSYFSRFSAGIRGGRRYVLMHDRVALRASISESRYPERPQAIIGKGDDGEIAFTHLARRMGIVARLETKVQLELWRL